MQYFRLVSFLFQNNVCETGSVCVRTGSPSTGERHMIVEEGDLCGSIKFTV